MHFSINLFNCWADCKCWVCVYTTPSRDALLSLCLHNSIPWCFVEFVLTQLHPVMLCWVCVVTTPSRDALLSLCCHNSIPWCFDRTETKTRSIQTRMLQQINTSNNNAFPNQCFLRLPGLHILRLWGKHSHVEFALKPFQPVTLGSNRMHPSSGDCRPLPWGAERLESVSDGLCLWGVERLESVAVNHFYWCTRQIKPKLSCRWLYR